MSPPIDNAEVLRIARLAHLESDEADVRALTRDLERILGYVALLDELEVPEVEADAALHPSSPALRDDEPAGSVTAEEALANAPEALDGHFRVPRVLDE